MPCESANLLLTSLNDPQVAIKGDPLSDTAVSRRKAIPRLIRAAAAGAIGLAAVGGLAAFAGPALAASTPGTAGAAPPTVYVQTDNPAGNQVIAVVWPRAAARCNPVVRGAPPPGCHAGPPNQGISCLPQFNRMRAIPNPGSTAK